MGIFGKEDEYIDYTLLKKKGLLRVEEEKVQQGLKTEGGFIDLTPAKTEVSKPSEMGNFGFLGDMASQNSSQTVANPLASFDSIAQQTATAELASTGEREFNALKIKVDDIDYKIDRFIERIDRLEEKLSKLGQGNF